MAVTPIKTLTLIQPWATLIALGEKKFETRSWPTKHRGELAIHAGLKIDKAVCRIEPFRSVLDKHGYNEDNLPVGAIIATCRLSGCDPVIRDMGTSAVIGTSGQQVVDGNEYRFGNYNEGRFAWRLTDLRPLETPIPAKGRLDLWDASLIDP